MARTLPQPANRQPDKRGERRTTIVIAITASLFLTSAVARLASGDRAATTLVFAVGWTVLLVVCLLRLRNRT